MLSLTALLRRVEEDDKEEPLSLLPRLSGDGTPSTAMPQLQEEASTTASEALLIRLGEAVASFLLWRDEDEDPLPLLPRPPPAIVRTVPASTTRTCPSAV